MRRRSRAGGKSPNAQAPKAAARKSRVAPKAARSSTAAREETKIARLTRELNESLQRQAASAEVLKVISRSTFDLPKVLDTLVETAARLCEADKGQIIRPTGKDAGYYSAASSRHAPEYQEYLRTQLLVPGRGSVTGRVLLEGKSVQIPDVLADPEYTFREAARLGDYRTILGVPLMREKAPIGLFVLQRRAVCPFTDMQIKLVETFADQAVIAIENTRLFEAEQQRTRELTESLEQQTATAEVLQVISSSPGELDRVFAAMLKNAVRICRAKFGNIYHREGDALHLLASHNTPAAYAEHRRRSPLRFDEMPESARRMIATREPIQDNDILAIPEYVERNPAVVAAAELGGIRTILNVPMLKENKLVGAFIVSRQEVQPFTDKQIALVQNFAAQAVIAIENARLLNELRQRTDDLSQRTTDLTEALEQQTAISEILRVISNSPNDVQPVLDSVAEHAAHICEVQIVQILLAEDDKLRTAATFGQHGRVPGVPLDRSTVSGRSVCDRQSVAIADLQNASDEFALGRELAIKHGHRSTLAVPLIREGRTLGTILVLRTEVRPFEQKHIALLTTFADQAAIAIENVRLFEAEQQRTRELSESLEQQTATSDVLRVISNSPTDIQPVFETIGERAEKLCDAEISLVSLVDGELIRLASIHGLTEAGVEATRRVWPVRRTDEAITARAIRTRSVCHVADVLSDPQYQYKDHARISGYRGCLGVPMVRDEQVVGAIFVARREPGLFSDTQVQLLKTFADQAVIAIENVRLFKETKDSLEQQTATADVLKVISRSTFELETVLDTLTESAVRLCMADTGSINQRIDDAYWVVSSCGYSPESSKYFAEHPLPLDRGSITGRVAAEGKVIHLADVLADPEYRATGWQQAAGYRTALGVPLLRDGTTIGMLTLVRNTVNPFTEKQIELVTTFADQAVIAIENTRLLNELRESLQQQTATADVLKVISRSTFDLRTVLQTLVESAAHLCDADKTIITRQKNGVFYRAEAYGFSREFIDYVRNIPIQPERGSAFGRALLERRAVHIPDVKADLEYTLVEGQRLGDYRTSLAVPMLREGVPTGVLSLARSEVRPFTEKQIELASTFADQAAIAIENVRLFENVEARTRELAKSLEDLRTTQDRLVQTQKLASLGQLTAGIAHEIKNPLNFVNNFSGVSAELLDELQEALDRVKADDKTRAEITELADTLRDNLDKIVQHGKRADAIVKNMLLHSREGSGEHRPVDINSIVEESLNLAYHGARAENQGFKITMERSFDPAAGEIDVFPQEITRALLNLISNGFYAATKRKEQDNIDGYEPTLLASTKSLGDRVAITIRDNGPGIPPEVREKMFNPFFTTKPAGEGTGLGLSITHDIIVKQHAGSIEVDTQPGEFTEFRIVLPRASAAPIKSGERM